MKLLNLQVKKGQSKWMMHASKRKAGFMFRCERYTRNNEANKNTMGQILYQVTCCYLKRERKDDLTEYDVNLITKAYLENSEESPNKSYFTIKKKNLETGGQTQHHYQKMLCQSGRYCKIFRGEFSCSIPQSCEKPFYVQKGKCDT